MRDGTPGRAVILDSEQKRLNASAAHFVYRLTLEVHYDDGSTAEIIRTVTPFEVRNEHEVGDVLPVRYDPADHSDVDVDVPALKDAHRRDDERLGERRVATARASLDPAESGDMSSVDSERHVSEWLERLVRLKLGRADGRVSESDYQAGLAAARRGLLDGTAVLITGEDADYVIGLANALIGDPVPGDTEDVENARRSARLLEQIVRLKLRHESGELDDGQFRAARAALSQAVQDEAERLG
jgi:hypothetical protein